MRARRSGPRIWKSWPITVRAGPVAPGPAQRVVRLAACEPERTGDREFRVLLSEGLTITQFAGLIPPGRAPAHHHSYDEVVHVLAGRGVVHLDGTDGRDRAGYLDLPAAVSAALPGEHRFGSAGGARRLLSGRQPGRQAGVLRRPAATRAC